MFSIEEHLVPRGRTAPLDLDLVQEIIVNIIEEHAKRLDQLEEEQNSEDENGPPFPHEPEE